MHVRLRTMFAAATLALLTGCSKSASSSLPSEEEARSVRQNAAKSILKPRSTMADFRVVRLPTVKDAAADALGRIGEEALPALVETLRDKNPAARRQAAHAIGLIGVGDPRAVNALRDLLFDPDETVRQQAARALGSMGPAAKAAIPDLIDVLKEPEPSAKEPSTGK